MVDNAQPMNQDCAEEPVPTRSDVVPTDSATFSRRSSFSSMNVELDKDAVCCIEVT